MSEPGDPNRSMSSPEEYRPGASQQNFTAPQSGENAPVHHYEPFNRETYPFNFDDDTSPSVEPVTPTPSVTAENTDEPTIFISEKVTVGMGDKDIDLRATPAAEPPSPPENNPPSGNNNNGQKEPLSKYEAWLLRHVRGAASRAEVGVGDLNNGVVRIVERTGNEKENTEQWFAANAEGIQTLHDKGYEVDPAGLKVGHTDTDRVSARVETRPNAPKPKDESPAQAEADSKEKGTSLHRITQKLRELPDMEGMTPEDQGFMRNLIQSETTFNRLRNLREQAFDDAQAGNARAQRELELIEDRINQMVTIATDEKLFRGIDNRKDAFEADIRKMTRGTLTAEQQQELRTRVRQWRAVDAEKTPLVLQGIGEYRISQHRETMLQTIDTLIQNVENNPNRILDFLRTKEKLGSPGERVPLLAKITDRELLFDAINIIFEDLEQPDMTPDETLFKGYRQSLDAIRPLLVDQELASVIDARLRLQTCWSALQKVNTADRDTVKNQFGEVKKKIGGYSFTGDSLNVFLGDRAFGGEIAGFATREAVQLMYENAKRGLYSQSQSEASDINEVIAQQLLARHANNGMTLERARIAVKLGARVLESWFESPTWDETGGEAQVVPYIAEMAHFGAFRAREKKGYGFSRTEIPTIFRSPLREMKYAKEYGGQLVFFADEWGQITIDTPISEKVAKAMSLQVLSSHDPHIPQFEGVDFRQIEKDYYLKVVTSKIPKAFEIEDIVLKVDYSPDDIQPEKMASIYEKLKQYDSKNTMDLFFHVYAHALRGAARNHGRANFINDKMHDMIDKGFRASDTTLEQNGQAEIAGRIVDVRNYRGMVIDGVTLTGREGYKAGYVYPFLKETRKGTEMGDFLRRYSGFQSVGAGNAMDDFFDDFNLVRIAPGSKKGR